MHVVKQIVQQNPVPAIHFLSSKILNPQKSKIELELTGPELSAPLNSAQLISAQLKKTLLDPPLKQNNLCFEAIMKQCTSN